MNQKGMVLKIQNGFCYVLTPDSQFLKIPALPDAQIGQEIEWAIQGAGSERRSRQRSVNKRTLWKPIVSLVASVALAVGIFQGNWFDPPKAFAYVSLDINPSIELAVDKKNHVLQQQALNTDGQKVLAEVSILHQPVDEAIQMITKQANQDGFVTQDGDILITTTSANPTQDQAVAASVGKLQQDLVQQVKQAIPQKHVTVQALTVSQDVRTAAEKYDLSPGKFAVYLQAQAEGVPVTVDQVRQQPISKLVKEHKELQESIQGLDTKLLDKLLVQWKNEPADTKQNKAPDSSNTQQDQSSSQSGIPLLGPLGKPKPNNQEVPPGQSKKLGHDKQNKDSPAQNQNESQSQLQIDVNPLLKIGSDGSGPDSYSGPDKGSNNQQEKNQKDANQEIGHSTKSKHKSDQDSNARNHDKKENDEQDQ